MGGMGREWLVQKGLNAYAKAESGDSFGEHGMEGALVKLGAFAPA